MKTFLSSGEIFDKISDITRIVDPLLKRVVEHKNNEAIIDNLHCFAIWEKTEYPITEFP